MKDTHKKLGTCRLPCVIALVAVIGFSITTCDSGGGGGGGAETLTYKGKGATSGDTYTLNVKKTAARAFTPIKGDEFELTDGTDKSQGKVDSFDGSKFTLQPSNDNAPTFDATVSGNDLTDLSGTITLIDGRKVTVNETLTPVTPPNGGGSMKWTAVSNQPLDNNITAIAFGNNKFIALGNNKDSSVKMAYSSDGKTWTAVTDSVINDMGLRSIAYGKDKFIVGGSEGQMAYSSDGLKWTAVSSSTFSKYAGIDAIAYGNNRFVAVDSSANHNMAYSTDGVTWTAIGSSNYEYVLEFGGGKFITGGYTGHLWYSTDGITWTVVENTTTSGGGEHIKGIAYGNNKFVAVGDQGSVATSPDGITWIVGRKEFITATAYIVYGGGKFIIWRNSKTEYSTDGTTWNTVDVSNIFSGSFGSINGIAFGNGTFVAVGASVTGDSPNFNFTGKIAYSTGN